MFNIEKVIDNESIEVYAFVIISPYTKKSTGVEAVCKGIDPESGKILAYYELQSEAKRVGLEYKLHHLFFKKTLERFTLIHKDFPDLFLFVNINETMLGSLSGDQSYWLNVIGKYEVPFRNIVLEFNEFSFDNLVLVSEISSLYRMKGFFISLDYIGKGYLNLDKIIMIRPDFIKLRFNYLDKIEHPNYRSYLAKNIKQIAENIGALIITIEVETQEDMVRALNSGSQFLEGYYINQLMVFNKENIYLTIAKVSEDNNLKDYIESIKTESNRYAIARYINKFNDIMEFIKKQSYELRLSGIKHLLEEDDEIEGVYFLDLKGIQTCPIYRKGMLEGSGSTIFNEYEIYSDHSKSSEYIHLMQFSLDLWVTTPFWSPFSYSSCITTSSKIELEEEKLILCIVFKYSLKDENRRAIGLEKLK